MTHADYRERAYAEYASVFQNAKAVFDAETARHWSRPYRRHFRGWLPTSLDAPILEVACGGGRMLLHLKDSGYRQVQGIDISPEQVAISRQVLAAEAVHEGDVLSFLGQRPRGFEVILAMDFLEHLSKPEALRFLDACFTALAPGGRLILQTPNAASPWGAEYRYADFTHEQAFTAESCATILRLCGYAQVEARELGPMPLGLKSTIRWGLWALLRSLLKAWNYVEMGGPGSAVLTRIMLVSAVKPKG